MKIELINENQIKCTLTRSDLAGHHIRLSELAYGTDKTKDLFQDMMDQAFTEFGFEATESLMIEAIPVSMDCIILMITNIDNPEEMDQGFSGFSNMSDFIMQHSAADDVNDEELDELIDSLSDDKFFEDSVKPAKNDRQPSVPETVSRTRNNSPLERLFSFDSLSTVIEFAHACGNGFKGKSALYKSDNRYYMFLVNSTRSINMFGHICSLALEYGCKESGGMTTEAYLNEHFELLIPENALQKLADL